MNLSYVKDVYGYRHRIDLNQLETEKKLLKRYNQFGEPLRGPDTAGGMIHRDNIAYLYKTKTQLKPFLPMY